MFKKLKEKIVGFFKKNNNSDLEDALIEADFGFKLANKLAESKNSEELKLKISEILNPLIADINIDKKPYVITLCGTNGSGKTTTVAKLIYKFQRQGLTVSVAACDTFRAAADDQLEAWCNKLGSPLYKSPGKEPASLAFLAFSNIKTDILIIDTAGRLPNNANLMNELAKIYRVLQKIDASAPHLNIMVIDATLGQQTSEHIRLFNAVHPIDGLILSKIDGKAKGGAILQIANELSIKILGVGTGESEKDLEPFSINKFLADF